MTRKGNRVRFKNKDGTTSTSWEFTLQNERNMMMMMTTRPWKKSAILLWLDNESSFSPPWLLKKKRSHRLPLPRHYMRRTYNILLYLSLIYTSSIFFSQTYHFSQWSGGLQANTMRLNIILSKCHSLTSMTSEASFIILLFSYFSWEDKNGLANTIHVNNNESHT